MRVGFWGFIVVCLLLLRVLLHPHLCILANQFCQNFENYPPVIIPPTAGAMGNIVSSEITVPKELIAQQMQAGAKGRSGEVWLKILEKDGILGLHQGILLLLLRNLPAGVLGYSSFEYGSMF
ncbi:hypothetical protein OIU77_025715 [Salix suchowensis]|uniref:Uncharacterized protein n=1 Tax=Salix suchowensis TaxID=1278906 RepID=A0ABQ9BX70_9ROSI|nr:hypothetical protein OIU77_025715 [Salix suchowensis]